MHSVDRTTEQMIRSVLAYAENRLRLDPVPLDHGARPPEALDAVFGGLLGEKGTDPDQVLGIYASAIAPAVISADSPRFLGFIPSAPTKAALLFDMLVSCASIQGISWLEAAGAIHAENQVLRLLADLAGLPRRPAAPSSAAAARATSPRSPSPARPPRPGARTPGAAGALADRGRLRRALEHHQHPAPARARRARRPHRRPPPDRGGAARGDRGGRRPGRVAGVVATAGTTNAGIVDDLAGVGAVAQEFGWWFHVDAAYGGAGLLSPALRHLYAGIEFADSFIVDPHKWLFTPFDCCAADLPAAVARPRRAHPGRLVPRRHPRGSPTASGTRPTTPTT